MNVYNKKEIWIKKVHNIMFQREKAVKVRKIVIFLACLLFLVYFSIKNIHSLFIPVIHMDEIGYWANAAFWDDKNWSSIMDHFSPYYSYGYSMILYLLMKLFKNPVTLYQAAIVVNIVMLLCGYCVLNWIIKKIFLGTDSSLRNIICLIPFFYPSIQAHAHIAWAETYLLLLFLFSVMSIMTVYEKGTIISYIVYALILVDMYNTHQRCIAILGVGIILLLFINILKKNRWRQSLVFAIMIVLCLLGSKLIKQTIVDNVYTAASIEIDNDVTEKDAIQITDNKTENKNNVKIDANDYSGQISKIKYMFTLQGFKDFVLSFFGKLYYFILASLFLGGMGLWYLIQQIVSLIKEKKIDNRNTLVYCYIVGAFLGTMTVSAVYTIGTYNRIDGIAYGRYTDWLGALIITFGIFMLLSSDFTRVIKTLSYQIFFCIIFLNIYENCIAKYQIAISNFNINCSQVFLYFFQKDEKNMLKTMMLMQILYITVICILKIIKNRYIRVMLMASFLINLWIKMTNPVIEHLISLQNTNMSGIYPIVEFIEAVQAENIYYFYDDTADEYINLCTGGIQYLLHDIPVQCIQDIMLAKEDSIIIVDRNLEIPYTYTTKCETIFYKVIILE